jgi:UDP-N-acetylglucosamine--N-acetylmuramyl-(pentapeptide) pyrophosphoryl-undecaprenol N-acetylglucosamine transferase
VALSVLIAGGGTGGHLYPGIAVARALLARVPDAQVTFVGTAAGIESRVVPREGFALDVIRSAGLKGKSLPSLVRRESASDEVLAELPRGRIRPA